MLAVHALRNAVLPIVTVFGLQTGHGRRDEMADRHGARFGGRAFVADDDEQVFYIGSQSPDELETIRRDILSTFEHLPIAGEYMHQESHVAVVVQLLLFSLHQVAVVVRLFFFSLRRVAVVVRLFFMVV